MSISNSPPIDGEDLAVRLIRVQALLSELQAKHWHNKVAIQKLALSEKYAPLHRTLAVVEKQMQEDIDSIAAEVMNLTLQSDNRNAMS